MRDDTDVPPRLSSAVSNSSPLILYSAIGRLDVVRAIFDQVLIPPAVWREVVASGLGRSGAQEVHQSGWILRQALPDHGDFPLLVALDSGEAEAITLAASLDPMVSILLDDRRARRTAQDLGLAVIGSAGLLVRAKETGFISAVRPILVELMAAGLYLSDTAAREILQLAGEQ